MRTLKSQETGPAPKRVDSLAFSPDGRMVAVGCEHGLIRTYDIQGLKLVAEFQGNPGPVLAVDYRKDGRVLASAGMDSQVLAWDVPAQQLLARIEHPFRVYCLAYSRDGRWLVTGGSLQGSRAMVWDAQSLKLKASLQIPKTLESVGYLSISPDSRLLATPGDQQGSVFLWDLEQGRRTRTFPGRDGEGVTGLAFAPDGKELAVLLVHEVIQVWDLETGQERRFAAGRSVGTMAFSPAGDYLVSAGSADVSIGSPGLLVVWSHPAGRKVAQFLVADHPINCIGFSGDGDTFATGSSRGAIGLRVWSLKDLLKDHPVP